MIKYIGSKRRLAPVLATMAERLGVQRALDLFTGTTRVAAALKARGVHVTAVDTARYAHVFARARIETDADTLDDGALDDALAWLQQLPGRPGYVTETFCRQARYFQPFNGERIDAVRDALEHELRGSPLFPVLLTSLIEAADRVDSTTGVQMAYVKRWSDRSARPLELRRPELLAGPGVALRGDACELAGRLGHFDLAYLDPPYNQHRYYTNYHVWETLVAWDAPEHYGVACKRLDSRDAEQKSVFNRRREMPRALAELVRSVDASLVALSYNDEAWLGLDELVAMCAVRGAVAVLAFEGPRYVGAQIGIHNPAGARVGTVGRLRNVEYLLLAGPDPLVREAAGAARAGAARTGAATPARSRRDVVDLHPINVAGGLSI
ncbi:MAG: DNA adenine methylase [Actinomycetota bacterium]|nr:DNA adenine methylase [Actinomycetota bacterium]